MTSKKTKQKRKAAKNSISGADVSYEHRVELDRMMYRDAFDEPMHFMKKEETAYEKFKARLRQSEKINENSISLRDIIIKQHPDYTELQIKECMDDINKRVRKEFPELFGD